MAEFRGEYIQLSEWFSFFSIPINPKNKNYFSAEELARRYSKVEHQETIVWSYETREGKRTRSQTQVGGVGDPKNVSASGSEVTRAITKDTYKDCDGNEREYQSSETLRDYTVKGESWAVMEGSGVTTRVDKRKTTTATGKCKIETKKTSYALASSIYLGGVYWSAQGGNYDRVSSTSVKRSESSEGRKFKYTLKFSEPMDYQYALSKYQEVMDKEQGAPIYTGHVDGNGEHYGSRPDFKPVDGRLYGRCGDTSTGGRVIYLLSEYTVWGDKIKPTVVGVNATSHKSLELVLIISESLGKPSKIRVKITVAHWSQDDPVVATVVEEIDDFLTLDREVDPIGRGGRAWSYSLPSSLNASFKPPVKGGKVVITRLDVQLTPDSPFTSF